MWILRCLFLFVLKHWHFDKYIDQWNRIESSEINSHIWSKDFLQGWQNLFNGERTVIFFFNKSWQESRIRTCRKQSWALSSCTPAETLTPRRLQTGAESNTIKLSEGDTGDRPCGTGVGNELAKAEAPQGKARCAGLAGEHPQWQKTVTSHAFHELLDPPVSTLRGRRQSQVVHLIRH